MIGGRTPQYFKFFNTIQCIIQVFKKPIYGCIESVFFCFLSFLFPGNLYRFFYFTEVSLDTINSCGCS